MLGGTGRWPVGRGGSPPPPPAQRALLPPEDKFTLRLRFRAAGCPASRRTQRASGPFHPCIARSARDRPRIPSMKLRRCFKPAAIGIVLLACTAWLGIKLIPIPAALTRPSAPSV